MSTSDRPPRLEHYTSQASNPRPWQPSLNLEDNLCRNHIAPDQVVNRPNEDPTPAMSTTAFPLRLPYTDKGYHQILATSLFEGTPLVKWSKKVAQWNSKLNGFCYLKQFTRYSRATIANCLGPFPEGSEIQKFMAFKHDNAKDIITDATGPRTYHH